METARPEVDTGAALYVVLVTGTAANGAAVRGTGFIVDAQGHVATCRHVVCPRGGPVVSNLRVALPYPARAACAYQVLGESAEDDLAILAPTVPLEGPMPQCLQHDDRSAQPQVGQEVTVWGYSAPELYTHAQRFDCTISGFSGPYGRIGLAGNVNFGDSGGPVLDAQRHLVGIAQAKDANRDGQAMAIPASLLRKLLHEQHLARAPASGAERVFQAPPLPDYALVGREKLLQDLKVQLTSGHHLALCFRPGVGKSTLATALARDEDVRAQFDGVLWANLNVRANVLTELRKWAVALALEPEKMQQLERLVPDAADPAQAAQQIHEAWAQALTAKIGERRMLLVIDDAWEIEPARVMLLGAPNCCYLITTPERVKVAGMLELEGFDVRVVEDLTLEDGIAFLRQLAPAAVEMFPQEASRIFHAVDGLPLALMVLGKYLRQESLDKRRRRIQDAYRAIEQNLLEKLGPVALAIKVGYDHLPGDNLREAAKALAIFRPKPGKFTEEAALAVLGQPAEVLDRLHDAGLIETSDAGDDPYARPYTMHRTIAEFARAQLDDPKKQELHRRAADYFAQWLRQYEESEEDAGRYGHQYRYENPQWQDAMDDFLYHLARAGDPTTAMVHFAAIYFSAFWWWGCYTDFSFSTRLLQQASSKRLSPEVARSLELLLAFDAAYPKECLRDEEADADGQEDAGDSQGAWAKVEAALTELRRLGVLEGAAPARAAAAWRHTRVLTDIFLAEALRFGRQQYAEAERLYRDALELLPADDWSVPWVHYHLADMFLKTGRLEEAAAHCASCLALADAPALKDRDNEVLANAWRVRAEVSARTGKRAEVLEGLQRMVLHAYAFQAIPEPPDAYTVAFYKQITRRAAGLLQELHRADPAFAQSCCEAVREYWRSYRELVHAQGHAHGHSGASEPATEADRKALLEGKGTSGLAAWLFPRAPHAGDMHKRGSRYFNEVITLFREKVKPA